MPHRTIVTRLKATAAVTALVPAVHIRPLRQIQNVTLPAITYEVTDYQTDDGINQAGSTVLAELSVICWADTYDEAWDVAEEVRTALHYYREGNDAGELMQCRCTAMADAPELPDDGSETAIHAVTQTYSLDYRKA